MFHERCMIKISTDRFSCRPCLLAGQPLESDESGDDSASNESGVDAVDRYKNIFVGMDYFGGTVREIYPEFDRVTVQFHNGEIQHLALAKVSKRISEDVNRMD